MPEALAPALSLPGFGLLIGVTVVAGIVYGFAGFGAALITVPLIAAIYTPADAVGIFSLTALASLVTVVPRAWREGDRVAAGQLLASASASLPLGVFVLRAAPPDALRWAICVLVFGTLAALAAGWRRRGADTRRTRLGVGVATGLVGGATGLTGPVVVLFQLSGRDGAGRIRANIVLFLSLFSILMLPFLVLSGVLGWLQATIGIILLPVYALATAAGQAMFRPAAERFYRAVAYAIIGAAGVVALPVWR